MATRAIPEPVHRAAHDSPDASAFASVVSRFAPRYDEPWRRYHTRTHVEEMLVALRHLTGEEDLHPALELATWAHDAVYDPLAGAGENERASADLAQELLADAHVPPELTSEVVALVLATADHEPAGPENADDAARWARMAAFLDADLWILAAPAPRFAEYEAQVRDEFHAVPDDLFTQGRAAILDSFARREWIYLTERARRDWEVSARNNLSTIGHHGIAPQSAASSASSNQPSG